VVVEGDRSRRNRLFLILLDFSLIIIVVLMQIANFCKQNYLAMTHVENWWITFFIVLCTTLTLANSEKISSNLKKG
jgi:uncharacterized membrane protein